MKKVLSLVIVLAMMLTVAALVPVQAAKKAPIVYGYTSQFKDFPGYPKVVKDEFTGFTEAYDAENDALVMNVYSGLGSAYFGTGYASELPVDTSVYKYVKVCYKIATEKGAGQVFAVQFGGGVWSGARLEWGVSSSDFVSKVIDLTDTSSQINGVNVVNHEGAIQKWEDFGGVNGDSGNTMSFVIADIGSGSLVKGDNIYVKYVAFFADKAEADAFDIANYTPDANVYNPAPESSAPESSAPESSTPESSTPESSAPESSAPESSKPESSKPESSKPSADTGHGTLITGAVMMFAAAAAVVVISGKKKA